MELSSDLMEVLIIFMSGFLQTTAGTHSLQYIYTAVTPGINFPEFTIVGQVDGQQFNYYDSKIRRMIPKTEWIRKNDAEDPEYWNRNTQIAQGSQKIFKDNVGTLMGRFTQTKGVHTLQLMYGCELDDDGTTRGYTQYGYDGEDYISFDLMTLTWIAPISQALITKNKWERDTGFIKGMENYLKNTCIEWLKKYVSYGKDTLERKVRPEVSVIHKHTTEVVCHATGFFPKAVMITWQKDGEDAHEDVELRETLPNQDGSFQKRSILKVPAEELQKHNYTCVVQHSSLEKELVREVPKGTHSLQYIYTAVTPGIQFPEFTIVGQVDGQQFNYYDSKIRRMIPKTEWIQKFVGDNYWSSETQISQSTEEAFKVNVGTLMQRFNQTKGVHTAQLMYGCELDDDGTTRGYTQYGYDGEDYISFDLMTLTWIAPISQALITKNKWERDTGFIKGMENYLKNTCIEWLKKYLSYGKETLGRKVRPEVSVFQKHSPSPEVVCHATNFFPKSVMITWQKDGEDVYEDVDLRETLPNQDGSFQKRSILKVPAEELQKHTYTCVVQHSSLEKEWVPEVPKGPNKPEM